MKAPPKDTGIVSAEWAQLGAAERLSGLEDDFGVANVAVSGA